MLGSVTALAGVHVALHRVYICIHHVEASSQY